MKILITVDPEIPVPPLNYGGIERIVDMLINGLLERGVDVVLLANKDSTTKAKLIPFLGENSNSKSDTLKNMKRIWSLTKENNFDIIHSFSRLGYLLPILNKNVPKIMSYQREPSIKGIKISMNIAKKNTMYFSGCSKYISDKISPYAPSKCIYNGCSDSIFQPNYNIDANAPLVFLGKIDKTKGPQIAIEVAKKSNRNLILAGNIPNDPLSINFFNSQIKPHIDNNKIKYIGPVDDFQKNILLQQAYCFLMPIIWNEPFGIVMAESMACGTPVLGFNRGSVPEVITHGQNGFFCNNVDEMVQLVDKIEEINRIKVRQIFESKFSNRVIVESYLNYYKNILKVK